MLGICICNLYITCLRLLISLQSIGWAHYTTMLIGWGRGGSLSCNSFIKEPSVSVELRPLSGSPPYSGTVPSACKQKLLLSKILSSNVFLKVAALSVLGLMGRRDVRFQNT